MLNLIVRAQTLGWRMKNRLERLEQEKGQTSSEYLVIAGIIVAIIIAIMAIFRSKLTQAMTSLGSKVASQTQ
jgi:Flp pilus assembly pilin Flp